MLAKASWCGLTAAGVAFFALILKYGLPRAHITDLFMFAGGEFAVTLLVSLVVSRMTGTGTSFSISILAVRTGMNILFVGAIVGLSFWIFTLAIGEQPEYIVELAGSLVPLSAASAGLAALVWDRSRAQFPSAESPSAG